MSVDQVATRNGLPARLDGPSAGSVVEHRGRSVRVWTAAAHATGTTVLFAAFLWLDFNPWSDSPHPWQGGSDLDLRTWFLLSIVLVLWVILAVRVRARTASSYRPGANDQQGDENDAPTAEGGGTVIACSGGGIKSASFCLGALQALDEADEYRTARAVVGVSGGGYIAGAYAARSYAMGSDPKVPVFPKDGKELAQLRTRTDYLAPSPRARLDLVGSLLFGVAINVLTIGSLVLLLAWVLAEQTIADGLVAISEWDPLESTCRHASLSIL